MIARSPNRAIHNIKQRWFRFISECYTFVYILHLLPPSLYWVWFTQLISGTPLAATQSNGGIWDTGIPVNCWSEGSSIQQCLSWCVLRHHHGFCDYWGRGRFRGASRVGVEMQKSFVSLCGQVGGCYFICEVVELLCCFLVVLFVLLHLLQTTVTIANWQMSFIHTFCVFSNESSYQELLLVCCLAVFFLNPRISVFRMFNPRSYITWIQLHPGHAIDG